MKPEHKHRVPEIRADRGWVVAAWPIAVIVLACVAAYWPSFGGAFVYDDLSNIVENEAIRQFWPPDPWLDKGRRPLVALTFVANYAMGGLDPVGYHAVNLAIHTLVALSLAGLIGRSARLLGWGAGEARHFAFGCALLFAVHPLATQAVTYTVQRSESLMALFYVLTLLGLVRSSGSVRPWAWLALSVVFCALGMASKAVMVTAPLAALLVDRALVSGSYRAALRSHWVYYLGLLGAGSILAFWNVLDGVVKPPPEYEATVGFAYTGITPGGYLLSQGGVILHYLRLVFWPVGLRLDYAWPVPASVVSALPAVGAVGVVGILFLTSAWFGIVKKSGAGLAAVLFFVILGPTSSFVPIKHLAFEHRMYLPLACVLVLVCLGVRLVLKRSTLRSSWAFTAFAVVLAVPLGVTTFARNAQYSDPLALWEQNAQLEPDSPAARTNLANELRSQGRLAEALDEYRAAAALGPGVAERHVRVGMLSSELGMHDEAVRSLGRAVEMIDKKVARSHPALQEVLRREQRMNHTLLAGALLRVGERERARDAFVDAVAIDSPSVPAGERALALAALGSLFQTDGEFAKAIDYYTRAIEQSPSNADTLARLGRSLAEIGERASAIRALERALAIDPSNSRARRVLDAMRE